MMKNITFFAVLFFHSCSLVFVKGLKGVDDDCDSVCSATEIRPVCGSDGKTYQTKCLLRIQKCTSGTKLFIDYNGPCRAPPSCTEERKRVLKSIRDKGLLSVGIFIPKCDSDGTYSTIQCHRSPVICWCVDKHGEEIEDSRVLFKQPDCRVTVRFPRTHERYKILRGMKGCSKENRISFNKKAVAMFKREKTKLSKKKDKSNFVEIVQWKMQDLDVDKNGHLQFKEVKTLIKKLKKAYSRKKCGKTLFYYCDKDQDDTISKKEWLACFGHQEVVGCMQELKTAKQLQSKDPDPARFIPSCNAGGTYTAVQCLSKYCWCVNTKTGRNIPMSSMRNGKPDCTKHALRTTKSTISIAFMNPYLAPRVIRIPKTSPPKPKYELGKKMKECDDANWARFSHELTRLFRKELEVMTGPKLQGQGKAPSPFLGHVIPRLTDTMILTWKFTGLDMDRDRLLNYEELFISRMKKLFGRIRRGRKCSKKLFYMCDFDDNKALSLSEWRGCLRRKNPKEKLKKSKEENPKGKSGSSRPSFLGR